MSLWRARPSVHMLSNSPAAARAAVPKPSKRAPAKADVYFLAIVSSRVWGLRVPIIAPWGGYFPATTNHLGVMGVWRFPPSFACRATPMLGVGAVPARGLLPSPRLLEWKGPAIRQLSSLARSRKISSSCALSVGSLVGTVTKPPRGVGGHLW